MAAGKYAMIISESNFFQILGVASNISGVLSFGTGIYSFVEGFLQPSSADILDAINRLEQTLNSDFTQLGNLIQQQTQIIVNTVDRDGMALALSRSDVATARMQAFLSGNDNEALETAKTESIAGVQFFSELGLSAPADLLFFLPGLVKAGIIRILVLASEPVSLREPVSVIVENVGSMVTLLSSMVDSVTNTVNAAHTVNAKSHTVQCSVIAQVIGTPAPALGPPHKTVNVIDGYSHNERGMLLEYFDAQQGNPPCEQPSGLEKGALADAQQARDLGATAELAALGIPQFRQILQSWRDLLAAATAISATATIFDLNGNWASGGLPGPVISVNGNSLSIDMSVYNRPNASGVILDSSHISVTFPDDNSYTAVLQQPGTIAWSNNSAWTKVPDSVGPIATLIDLNGTWASGGTPGPVISVNGNAIAVDMSFYKRPAASGAVLDSAHIRVNFPDDNNYTAQLNPPNTISWSNNSAWTRV